MEGETPPFFTYFAGGSMRKKKSVDVPEESENLPIFASEEVRVGYPVKLVSKTYVVFVKNGHNQFVSMDTKNIKIGDIVYID